jgi:hypothetical protein
MTYDPNTPAATQRISDTQAPIQTNFNFIQTGDESFLPQSINFNNRTPLIVSDDPTALANAYRLYCKEDADGNPELFGIDESSNILQFTAGAPTLDNNGNTFLIGGLLFQWFQDTVSNNQTVTFPKEFGSIPFVVLGNEATDNNTDFDFVKPVFASYTTTNFRVRLTRAGGDPQNDSKLLTFMAIGSAF